MNRANNGLAAETLGLKGLTFLAAAPEDFRRFLDVSGIDVPTVRLRAAERDFLAGVLDFLLTQEGLLSAFCEAQSIQPREVHIAARDLSGGATG